MATACGSSSSPCSSSTCYKNSNGDLNATTKSIPTPTDANSTTAHNLCIKCKLNSTIPSASACDAARYCSVCFRTNLYAKFRFAVTSHAMISPSDNVLVAFSGGPASRVLLQFVHEMQQRAQRNFDASKDRSLPVFGVGVAFIDESFIFSVPSQQVDEAIQEMRLVVSHLAPPTKELLVVPIENVYFSTDGKSRLSELLDAVEDATGKEDLLLHLRMLALQKVASENGYNRLVLGSCTSRIACHVIASTVKGLGYSLSADIQYVDARWEIPVVLPLRDCTAQELNLLCCLDGLKTVQLFSSPPSGINGLVSSFVTLLQEENPSRECTIVRTAGKLTPFHFNRIPEINDCNVPLATQRQQKRFNLQAESISSALFCPICNSPVKDSDLLSLSSSESCQSSNFGADCCPSCRFQIIPKDSSAMEHFSFLLPPQLAARAENGSCGNLNLLKKQIQDCLLSDSEDEA